MDAAIRELSWPAVHVAEWDIGDTAVSAKLKAKGRAK
jgi:hypothetical protein